MTRGKRWAYAGVVLGGGGSVVANVAHALIPTDPKPGSIIAAAFWPAALFVAVEILARVEWPSQRRWALLRWGGFGPLALVAAIVSYRHLSGLLGFYGEDPVTVAFGPLAVDGFMVVSTTALMALAGTSRVQEVHVPEPAVTPEVQVQVQTTETIMPRQGHVVDPDATVALELDLSVTPALDPVPVQLHAVPEPPQASLAEWVKDQVDRGVGQSQIHQMARTLYGEKGTSESSIKRLIRESRTRATATA